MAAMSAASSFWETGAALQTGTPGPALRQRLSSHRRTENTTDGRRAAIRPAASKKVSLRT
jgi:hypothetical protein